MKEVIVLSDIHLVKADETNNSLDTVGRLREAVGSINRFHPDAALCVLAGDLAEPDGYEDLRSVLSELTMPVRPMLGNHDDRRAFSEAFGDSSRDENGFIQSCIDLDGIGRLIFLDTQQPDRHEGFLCSLRLDWLDRRLGEADEAGAAAYVFMHHPPMAIGLRVDRSRLTNPNELKGVLDRHQSVRHLFAGHVHLPCSGSWHNWPYALFGPVHMTVDMHEPADGGKRTFFYAPAYYTVIRLTDETAVVHPFDFMTKSPSLAPQLFKD